AEVGAVAHRGRPRRRSALGACGRGPECHDGRPGGLPLPRRHSRPAGRQVPRARHPAWRDRSRPALLDLRPVGDRRSQARRIGEPVSKKRVHEIAKEHGLSSKELLEKLNAAGIEAKVAASSVEEALALKALAGDGAASAAPPTGAGSAPAPSAPPAARPPAPSPP